MNCARCRPWKTPHQRAPTHTHHPPKRRQPSTRNPLKRHQPSTHHPQNEINRPHAICSNETVGAVPACPPERPRSGVSIIKIHALCAGDERRMRPCRATRAGTQAPPLPISIIFFHAIPHEQNNHLRAIPHKRNQPFARNPPKRYHPPKRNA